MLEYKLCLISSATSLCLFTLIHWHCVILYRVFMLVLELFGKCGFRSCNMCFVFLLVCSDQFMHVTISEVRRIVSYYAHSQEVVAGDRETPQTVGTNFITKR